jgi:hypothetical protein
MTVFVPESLIFHFLPSFLKTKSLLIIFVPESLIFYEAVVASLIATYNFDSATDLVIGGCSAGGLAAYLHVDWYAQVSVFFISTLFSYHFSLLASRFLLFASRFSLLASRFSLLASRFSLLASHFSLLASRFSLLASRFSLLASRFSLSPFSLCFLFLIFLLSSFFFFLFLTQ